MGAKFTFFQEVKILNSRKFKKYIGFIGFIGGMHPEQTDETGYSYAVFIPQKGIAVNFDEVELEETGNFVNREDFYDGSYARVSPDGELLELHLVDKETNKSSDNEQ